MRKYELLPHTADIAVRASGSDRKELLAAAIQGMFAATEPHFKEGAKTVERRFRIESSSSDSLIIDLLNEALYLSDTHRETYTDVRFTALTDTSAAGIFIGRPVTGLTTQIKAATHHGLTIEKKADGWHATVIFDA